MSVDPYMQDRMYDRKSYVPLQLGMPLKGGCIGRVIESKKGPFQVGDYVLGMLGWHKYFVSDGQGLVKVDPGIAPIQSYLGTVGMPGLTAYAKILVKWLSKSARIRGIRKKSTELPGIQ